MDGLALYLGEGYEFVLHSLEDLSHSVVKIINGHYSNRKPGAPIRRAPVPPPPPPPLIEEELRPHAQKPALAPFNIPK